MAVKLTGEDKDSEGRTRGRQLVLRDMIIISSNNSERLISLLID